MGIKTYKFAASCVALILTIGCINAAIAKPLLIAQGDQDVLQKWLEYGNQQETAGHLVEAEKAYSQVIKKVPDNFDAYIHRGNVYRVANQYPKALADYNKALALHPGDPSALAGRAFNYTAMGQPEKAVEDFNKAIKFFSSDAANVVHICEAYVGRADASVQLRQYDQAINDYKYALRLNAMQPAAYEGRATAWIGLGRMDLAIDDVSRAIDLSPKKPAPLYELRYMLYKKTNNQDKQLGDLTQLTVLEPDKPVWHKERLKIAEDRHDKAMIADELGKLLAFDKNDVQGRIKHALMTWEDSPQAAIKDLDEAIDSTGGTAELYGLRGQIESKLGYNDSAIPDLTRAIQMEPAKADNYVYRSAARFAIREYFQAIDDADRAIGLNPKFAEAYFFKACAHESLGQSKDALGSYEKFVAMKSDVKKSELPEGETKQLEVAERKVELLKRAASIQVQDKDSTKKD